VIYVIGPLQLAVIGTNDHHEIDASFKVSGRLLDISPQLLKLALDGLDRLRQQAFQAVLSALRLG
jgi:hypothetical protein